ncbi:MAG: hypothetical protein KKF48_00075 [Nanoarchaeota archaeon]|nr:hypothetical protein [Nanoarchaeota archaeon]MBU1027420.1 hypothetical protein [Nanoarchaeota archaeon]
MDMVNLYQSAVEVTILTGGVSLGLGIIYQFIDKPLKRNERKFIETFNRIKESKLEENSKNLSNV